MNEFTNELIHVHINVHVYLSMIHCLHTYDANVNIQNDCKANWIFICIHKYVKINIASYIHMRI